MGRFINADGQLDSGDVLGLNLFAYCGNNPVNRVDPTGEAWWHWVLGTVAAVAAVAATVATLGALAPAAACTLTFMGTSIGLSYATASTLATIAVTGTTFAASMYAADAAYSAVTGSSFMLNSVFQGNVGAYNAGQQLTALATFGMINMAAMSPGVCFVAGTLVKTESGNVPIESIKTGDLVWAWDEETGDVALKEVVETYVRESKELIHVFVEGEEIITTPTHPFYSPVKGWTEACKLRAGDILVLVNGEYVVVEKVQHEILETPITVYNFQVEGYHTYYISDIGILVHNKCSGSYEIEFESGKNYVGKGGQARMQVSARVHSSLHNDPVVSMKWEYAPDAQTAFVNEYFKMAVRGVNNPNTYNLIWSPGRNIFINQWK